MAAQQLSERALVEFLGGDVQYAKLMESVRNLIKKEVPKEQQRHIMSHGIFEINLKALYFESEFKSYKETDIEILTLTDTILFDTTQEAIDFVMELKDRKIINESNK